MTVVAPGSGVSCHRAATIHAVDEITGSGSDGGRRATQPPPLPFVQNSALLLPPPLTPPHQGCGHLAQWGQSGRRSGDKPATPKEAPMRVAASMRTVVAVLSQPLVAAMAAAVTLAAAAAVATTAVTTAATMVVAEPVAMTTACPPPAAVR